MARNTPKVDLLPEGLKLIKCSILNATHAWKERESPVDHLVVWVLGGEGEVVIDGVKFNARADDLFTFVPGEPHRYRSAEGSAWHVMWAHFEGRLAAPIVGAIREAAGVRVRMEGAAVLRRSFSEMTTDYDYHRAIGAAEPTQLRHHAMLYQVLMLILDHARAVAAGGPAAQPRDLIDTWRYIHDHLGQRLTLADLAERAGMSPSHFARRFNQHFRKPPMRYIIDRRMLRAQEMLADTDHPMHVIARFVGYDDAHYFSRLFHRTCGRTPTAYRAAARGRHHG